MTIKATLIAILCLMATPALSGEPRWSLMSREDGCQSTELLARREELPRVPATPEEFAAMMRSRGHTVTVALPPGFPAELAGSVVQVTVRDNLTPVFVTEEICRRMDK